MRILTLFCQIDDFFLAGEKTRTNLKPNDPKCAILFLTSKTGSIILCLRLWKGFLLQRFYFCHI